ncbi:hypothetical protein KCQ_04961 [Pectobacterium atrosepticum ICMP 1526]|uniref:hypothetical protein n=1 Tax=Pectobacterium atrosepticum TaxID=29471 RepID=UPI000507A9F1|nr:MULTISPECIES: hypothetical protein [Pectobacterium]KFX10889.1 hypothetical protein JV34_22265 [Pectobacterium atrosepticum]KMK87562.1 hypothetical protein KCQ_04961 [Pectobacterium atrosepticum ICMP 1526]MCL6336380.1 hypothetical protein [Pectobacterium carotovorum subsp. carotovorum]QXE13031.1 hypothetical protein DCX48_00105 [Pectobacterium atrosepticum]
MAIQAHVIYTAIVESVVVNRQREDVLTKICETSGFIDVSLPEDSPMDYVAVFIADAIARKNCFEINGKVVSVPSISAEHCRCSGKINLGQRFGSSCVVRGYLTLQLDELKNREWLAALGASVLNEKPASYFKLMNSPSV